MGHQVQQKAALPDRREKFPSYSSPHLALPCRTNHYPATLSYMGLYKFFVNRFQGAFGQLVE
jgi:hypothetical protein